MANNIKKIEVKNLNDLQIAFELAGFDFQFTHREAKEDTYSTCGYVSDRLGNFLFDFTLNGQKVFLHDMESFYRIQINSWYSKGNPIIKVMKQYRPSYGSRYGHNQLVTKSTLIATLSKRAKELLSYKDRQIEKAATTQSNKILSILSLKKVQRLVSDDPEFNYQYDVRDNSMEGFTFVLRQPDPVLFKPYHDVYISFNKYGQPIAIKADSNLELSGRQDDFELLIKRVQFLSDLLTYLQNLTNTKFVVVRSQWNNKEQEWNVEALSPKMSYQNCIEHKDNFCKNVPEYSRQVSIRVVVPK